MTWLVSSSQGLLAAAIIISGVSGVYGGTQLSDEFAKITSIMDEAVKASSSSTSSKSYIQSLADSIATMSSDVVATIMAYISIFIFIVFGIILHYQREKALNLTTAIIFIIFAILGFSVSINSSLSVNGRVIASGKVANQTGWFGVVQASRYVNASVLLAIGLLSLFNRFGKSR